MVTAVVQVPGFGANLLVPEGMTDGQTGCYEDQQRKDLHQIIEEECYANSNGKTKISTNQRKFMTATSFPVPNCPRLKMMQSHHVNRVIHELVDFGPFESRLSTIPHDFGVGPCEKTHLSSQKMVNIVYHDSKFTAHN